MSKQAGYRSDPFVAELDPGDGDGNGASPPPRGLRLVITGGLFGVGSNIHLVPPFGDGSG